MRKLISAVFKTGVSSLVSLLLNVVSVKVMAVLLGPSGVGLFSLIRQTVVTLAAVGMGGQTALVQGIASKRDAERDAYVRTVFWLFFLGSLFTVLLIEAFAPKIATLLVGSKVEDFTAVIRWIALPVVLSNVYIYLKAILNGFRAIGRLAIVETLGPLVVLILVFPVCTLVGKGYALAFVWMMSAAQLLMVLPSFLIAHRNGWLTPIIKSSHPRIDSGSARHFFRIAGITFVTGLLGMAAILVVRAMIARSSGLHEAGLFDLAWALSGSYVMLLLSSFGTYYMPTLSGTVEESERANLIRQVIRFSVLLMVPMIVGVVVLKPLLVRMLYSAEFLPSLDIVRWMLIGDYLKITSWVLAIPILAKLDMKTYFWTEVFWYVGFVLLSALSIFGYGQLQGIGVAFIILYLCLVIYYALYVQRVYKFRVGTRLAITWVIGLLIVLMASWQNWESTIVDWSMCIFWGMTCLVFLWMSPDKTDRLKARNIVKRWLGMGGISSPELIGELRGKPLVICVGAQKAATITLYALMKAHPEVCVSRQKETGFFYREKKYSNGYKWHLGHDFSQEQDKKILFEADPNYMFFPIAIDRIYACNPSAKIIVMLRNPVSRAYSHYLMMHNAGYEDLDFRDAYMVESDRLKRGELNLEVHSYLARSFYAQQIEHITSIFPQEQILFVVFERFVENQQEEYGKILQWLNLTQVKLLAEVKEIPELSYNPMRKFIFHPSVAQVRKYVAMIFGKRAINFAAMPFRSMVERKSKLPNAPVISKDVYYELLEIFEEDIQRVESLTGLDLSVWKK